MTHKLGEMLRRNVLTAFVVVALPLVVSLAVFGYALAKGQTSLLGYGFSAVVVALVMQYPYLKLCDRYFFK